jgi:glucose/arabinose dehydrogenase
MTGVMILVMSPSFSREVWAQVPASLATDVSVSPVTLTVDAVRMAYDPVLRQMVLLSMNGDISTFDPHGGSARVTKQYSYADHSLPLPAMGLAIDQNGTYFIVGNDAGSTPGYNIGVVKRGVVDGTGARTWVTVIQTEPYPRSGTNYDHNMNGVVVSPDGTKLYVNSGSRTDHGEVQDNNGTFPGLREVPLTSAILEIPADASGLILENDQTFLEQSGFLYADGLRNSFSLAFDGLGRLYATENSGDRDDHEELNLIQKGGHYGFPWQMGLTDTPMQFAGYNPANDLLLNPAAGAVQGGEFYDDPAFPAIPNGVSFLKPVKNLGPDADLYRSPVTGEIRDASIDGVPMATFTSHRSPLGLTFDISSKLPEPYSGDGFVLSWTGSESPLLAPFSGEGEDVLHLDFGDNGTGEVLAATRIASGFINPIDAVLIDRALFVLEFGSGARVWKIEFNASATDVEALPEGSFALETFPNPAVDRFQVSIQSSRPGAVQVDLVDLTGKTVETVFSGYMAETRLDLTHILTGKLAGGVYILTATIPGFSRQVRKIVIQ